MNQSISASENFWVRLNYLYFLGVLLVVCFILTTAMVLQYVYGELPCPLCLLQRVAYFGICFGIILCFRNGYSLRYSGFSMLFTLYLLIVSIRQSLLDIVARPGHAWIGSAILGLHLPIWSIIISLTLLTIYALKLSILKHGDFLKLAHIENYPFLRKCAYFLTWYLILLCAINLVSVAIQCGFHICHTEFYRY